MKQNKGVIGIGLVLAIVLGAVVIGGGAYYVGNNNGKKEVINPVLNVEESLPDVEEKVSEKVSDNSKNGCSEWLTYNGIYTVKYPSCWKVESVKGGSIGSTGYETGIILKPLNSNSDNDYIFIAGWQADCSNINVSGGENPSTKAFCFKPENGEKWQGEYITSLNEGKLYGVPVRTMSKNQEVLKMFDLIVNENKSTTKNIFTENLKTYTNAEFGFTFNYPISWELSEDKLKKEVTIDTNDKAGGVDGMSYPSWRITFKSTDKSFFNNNRVSTKMGIITYDENLKALVSDSCIKAEGLLGTNTIQAIRYGGSLMSDPAYSNSAILTTSGKIINIDSYQGVPSNPQIENQLSTIIKSFGLLNGNAVFVPQCAK